MQIPPEAKHRSATAWLSTCIHAFPSLLSHEDQAGAASSPSSQTTLLGTFLGLRQDELTMTGRDFQLVEKPSCLLQTAVMFCCAVDAPDATEPCTKMFRAVHFTSCVVCHCQ